MTTTHRQVGVVEASRGCFLFEAEELPQTGPRAEYGAILVDPGSGQLELLTDRDYGPVHLTVEVHDGPVPPTTRTWKEAVTATVRWQGTNTARICALEVDLCDWWEVPLPAPHFVLDVRYRELGEQEHWLLRLWPATAPQATVPRPARARTAILPAIRCDL
ncbi:hypothetical protein [Umezawaea beigongshangensis]|uniref:hypothetical protein n=1 Tax=Umezawaea beigongshangensis TaxID=2780383 RepID=UPI0018F1C6D0|nr:hypothetical protein [Umezawaea beigongshangensis]